jgi:hypothetical protein
MGIIVIDVFSFRAHAVWGPAFPTDQEVSFVGRVGGPQRCNAKGLWDSLLPSKDTMSIRPKRLF